MIDNGLGVGLLPDGAFALMRGLGRLAAVPWMNPGPSVSCAWWRATSTPLPVTARLLVEHLAPKISPSPQPKTPRNPDRHGTHPCTTRSSTNTSSTPKGRHRRALHRPPPGARGHQPAGLRGLREAAARSGAPAPSSPPPTTTRPPPAGSAATTALPTRSARSRSPRSTKTLRHGRGAFFPFLHKRQGIVHVIGPENGATCPA